MSSITFADVVHQSISLTRKNPEQALILELIDNPWVQRLRDISQTANTRLVYMFSEHSRFGHSLGVAHLALILMERLSAGFASEIESYRMAVAAAALLHDIGHLAPGSHTAFKAWFPDLPDQHEQLTIRILQNDPSLKKIFENFDPSLISMAAKILDESDDLPPWSWEIISGGGWNVDRGNWCIVDSILAGVSYGKYNIPALIDSIIITPDKHLALRENRLDAMMHFAVSRHAMYRQIYQHRVMLAADCLTKAIVQRARDLGDKISFADTVMRQALAAKSFEDLSLECVFAMREPWWRYHLMQWRLDGDAILSDLSDRLLNRKLLKTIRIREQDQIDKLKIQAENALASAGFDPRYYLHEISTQDVHAGDSQQSMLVLMDDGRVRQITDAEPIFSSLMKESKASQKIWLALPKEAKEILGRER